MFTPFNESILLEKKPQKLRGRVTLLMLHPCTLLPPIPWGKTGEWWTSLYNWCCWEGWTEPVGCTVFALKGTGCLCSTRHSLLWALWTHCTTTSDLPTSVWRKPLLSQQDSSFCKETKVCDFPPPGFPVEPRNSNECAPKHKFSTLSFQAVGSQGVACGSLGTRKMGKKWCMEQL